MQHQVKLVVLTLFSLMISSAHAKVVLTEGTGKIDIQQDVIGDRLLRTTRGEAYVPFSLSGTSSIEGIGHSSVSYRAFEVVFHNDGWSYRVSLANLEDPTSKFSLLRDLLAKKFSQVDLKISACEDLKNSFLLFGREDYVGACIMTAAEVDAAIRFLEAN